MRDAFAKELEALAQDDLRVVLLSGDIGNRMYDSFKGKFPDRFYNCGVAEANMTGVAAGMALSGLRPFTYTITTFNTQRCFEQIRLDVCYHGAPVTIVGVGGGLSYASLGPTHHSCEDIALLRVMPDMTVICPADPMEVRAAVRIALAHDGPVHIRLGKKGEPNLHKNIPEFKIGKAIEMRQGTDVCLFGVGTMLGNVLDAAEILSARGVSAQVYSFPFVKPLDDVVLRAAFKTFPLVATVEEHSLIGGAGSAVAEWLVDAHIHHGQLLRMGVPDAFMHKAGSQNYTRKTLGLDPDAIADRVQAGLIQQSKEKET